MSKGVIWGAGGTGRKVYEMSREAIDIICFVDSDETKWGGNIAGVEIKNPDVLKSLEPDVILLGTLMGLDEVPEQLKRLGISADKLKKTYVEISVKSRVLFVQRFAERVYKEGLEGSVAEAGVYRGEFAKYINRYFYNRKCYLFDTFEGFTDYDISKEQDDSLTFANHLKNVSIEEILSKMPIKENLIVKIGRFPETAIGIDEKFVFVNLDMDLYEPTIQGLRFFYPKMSDGGVILVHDYFNKSYPNIEKSIYDFERELGKRLHKIPIGDDISMAVIK